MFYLNDLTHFRLRIKSVALGIHVGVLGTCSYVVEELCVKGNISCYWAVCYEQLEVKPLGFCSKWENQSNRKAYNTHSVRHFSCSLCHFQSYRPALT